MKPGVKSSEFWLTISYLVISFLVLIGVVHSDNMQTAASDLSHTLEFMAFALSQGLVLWKYHHGREKIKQIHHQNEQINRPRYRSRHYNRI